MGLRAQYRRKRANKYRNLNDDMPIKVKKPVAKKKRYRVLERELEDVR